MTHAWDPERYLTYADERARPFVDLLARVGATAPATVVDLGCGPGTLTRLLADRWPGADVTGVDSSPEMVASAQALAGPRLRFELGDLRDWLAATARPAPQVLVSNATLQWVPDHLGLLPALAGAVAPGGWLAVQVPGNVAEPSHVHLRALAAAEPYARHTVDAVHPASHDPATYLGALAAAGCEVDAWETTYLHVLHGPDPVLRWISGTGARPVLQALPADLRERFSSELGARLREAYPATDHGVVLPFRRVFVVARAPGSMDGAR
jgi:trans-aconitate 2-methyltransferase